MRVIKPRVRFSPATLILFIRPSTVMFFVAWLDYFNSALFRPTLPTDHARRQLFGGVWPPKGIEVFDPGTASGTP